MAETALKLNKHESQNLNALDPTLEELLADARKRCIALRLLVQPEAISRIEGEAGPCMFFDGWGCTRLPLDRDSALALANSGRFKLMHEWEKGGPGGIYAPVQ